GEDEQAKDGGKGKEPAVAFLLKAKAPIKRSAPPRARRYCHGRSPPDPPTVASRAAGDRGRLADFSGLEQLLQLWSRFLRGVLSGLRPPPHRIERLAEDLSELLPVAAEGGAVAIALQTQQILRH